MDRSHIRCPLAMQAHSRRDRASESELAYVCSGCSVGAGAWSRVDGPVYDDAGARVEVLWEDGATQEADVVRASVLAVREGSHQYQEVRALDAEGEVVYVHEQPEIAPGKQGE